MCLRAPLQVRSTSKTFTFSLQCVVHLTIFTAHIPLRDSIRRLFHVVVVVFLSIEGSKMQKAHLCLEFVLVGPSFASYVAIESMLIVGASKQCCKICRTIDRLGTDLQHCFKENVFDGDIFSQQATTNEQMEKKRTKPLQYAALLYHTCASQTIKRIDISIDAN